MPPESRVTGNILINTKTGERKYFPQEELKQAIGSGAWRGQEGDAMYVVDASGNTRTLNAADAGQFFHVGGAAESHEHVRYREKEAYLEDKYGNSSFRAALESIASGVTFGLSNPLMVAFGASREGIRERNKRTSGWITGIGEGAGIVVPAILTGGGSLAVKGGLTGAKAAAGAGATGAARYQVPLAAAKYSRAAQPSMAAKIAGMTPAGMAHKLSMRGARAVTPQAVREGTATGVAGVLGRAGGWITQGVIDGVAYGAGTGFSSEILSDDPFTGEAMWDNMKAGALYGGIFGGSISVLGDTAKFFKSHIAGKRTARTVASDEAVAMARKEQWIKEETAKAATRKEVSAARKAERGAVRDQAKLDDEIIKNTQKTEKEIAALEKEIDGLVNKHEAATASAAMDLKRGHVRVAKAEEALDKAKLKANKSKRAVATTKAKAELKAAKENQATLQKAADDAEAKALTDFNRTRKQMEELLTTSSTDGVTKFTERMAILYKSARDHRGRGFALVRKEFNENWALTPGLSVTSKALDDALERFEGTFVAWDGRTAGYTRTQFGVTRVSEGARQNLRVVNVDGAQLARFAREDLIGFKAGQRAVEDLEAAIMAHRGELQKAIDGANAMRTVDELPLVKMDMPADINKLLGQQFSPAEYMKGVRNAVRLTDSQTMLEKVGTAEVLGDVSGDPIDGIAERLEDVPVVGGPLSTGVAALLWYSGLKGSKKTAGKVLREVTEHSKNEPLRIAGERVSAAKATLTAQEKRAAVDVLEEQVEAARMAGRGQLRREQELLDAMEEVQGLEALARTIPSGQTAANLESARARLEVLKKNRDATSSNAEAIAAAQKNVEDMRAATTLAEAKQIAQRADRKFGVPQRAKKRGGRIWRAVESGVSQGTYTQLGTRTFGKNWRGAVAGSIAASTARDVLGALRGRGRGRGDGVGGMVSTAVVRTQEKIVSGVGGFLGLVALPGKIPHAATSPVVLLNEMNFGHEGFKGKKRADEE